ncbi:MAG: hypothetical protein ACUVT1_09725 [Anaerolineae bacterium]
MSHRPRMPVIILGVLLITVLAASSVLAGPPSQGMAITRAETDKPTAGPGDEVRFLLQIQSTGALELKGLKVEYEAPAGLELVTASASRDADIHISDRRLNIDLGDIPPNGRVEISVIARVKSDAGEGTALVNHFRVSCRDLGSQEAVIGLSIAGRQPSHALPQAGNSIALMLVGIGLAAGILIIHQIRARTSP